MAAPSIRAVGALAAQGGPSKEVVLPTHDTNDILILAVESNTDDPCSTPAGWGVVTESPQAHSTFDSQLSVFWKRAASAAESNPTVTVTGPGDHVCGVAVSVQGCITTGDPWNVTSGGEADEAATLAGATTTVAECLVLLVASSGRNLTSSTTFDSWTNAELTGVAEIFDGTNTVGSGGGVGIATGVKTTAGDYGSSTVTITGVGGGYLTIALSPPAETLSFTQQPTTAVEGVVISPDVEVTSSDGTFTGNVTVALEDNPAGGTLGGTLTVAAVAGVATFNDLEIDTPGSYTLLATATGHTEIESDSFDITLEAATHLVFFVGPSDAQVDAIIAPPVKVRARNSENVLDTNYTANVVIAKAPGAPAGTLGGTLTVAAVAGVATFDDLTIDTANTGFVLRATSGALTLADSATFDITASPPPATPSRAFSIRMGAPLTMRL